MSEMVESEESHKITRIDSEIVADKLHDLADKPTELNQFLQAQDAHILYHRIYQFSLFNNLELKAPLRKKGLKLKDILKQTQSEIIFFLLHDALNTKDRGPFRGIKSNWAVAVRSFKRILQNIACRSKLNLQVDGAICHENLDFNDPRNYVQWLTQCDITGLEHRFQEYCIYLEHRQYAEELKNREEEFIADIRTVTASYLQKIRAQATSPEHASTSSTPNIPEFRVVALPDLMSALYYKNEKAFVEGVSLFSIEELSKAIDMSLTVIDFKACKIVPPENDGHDPIYFVDRFVKFTPLSAACLYGTPAMVQALLERGVSATKTTHESLQPLHFASKRGCLESIKLLLKYGANINIQCDARGYTSLHYALVMRKEDVVLHLLAAGADVNITPVNRTTAATMAVKYSTTAVIQKVCQLSNEASINASNLKGVTALFAAIDGANDVAVEQLLKHGADVSLKGNYMSLGREVSALYWACNNGTLNSIYQILIHGGLRYLDELVTVITDWINKNSMSALENTWEKIARRTATDSSFTCAELAETIVKALEHSQYHLETREPRITKTGMYPVLAALPHSQRDKALRALTEKELTLIFGEQEQRSVQVVTPAQHGIPEVGKIWISAPIDYQALRKNTFSRYSYTDDRDNIHLIRTQSEKSLYHALENCQSMDEVAATCGQASPLEKACWRSDVNKFREYLQRLTEHNGFTVQHARDMQLLELCCTRPDRPWEVVEILASFNLTYQISDIQLFGRLSLIPKNNPLSWVSILFIGKYIKITPRNVVDFLKEQHEHLDKEVIQHIVFNFIQRGAFALGDDSSEELMRQRVEMLLHILREQSTPNHLGRTEIIEKLRFFYKQCSTVVLLAFTPYDTSLTDYCGLLSEGDFAQARRDVGTDPADLQKQRDSLNTRINLFIQDIVRELNNELIFIHIHDELVDVSLFSRDKTQLRQMFIEKLCYLVNIGGSFNFTNLRPDRLNSQSSLAYNRISRLTHEHAKQAKKYIDYIRLRRHESGVSEQECEFIDKVLFEVNRPMPLQQALAAFISFAAKAATSYPAWCNAHPEYSAVSSELLNTAAIMMSSEHFSIFCQSMPAYDLFHVAYGFSSVRHERHEMLQMPNKHYYARIEQECIYFNMYYALGIKQEHALAVYKMPKKYFAEILARLNQVAKPTQAKKLSKKYISTVVHPLECYINDVYRSTSDGKIPPRFFEFRDFLHANNDHVHMSDKEKKLKRELQSACQIPRALDKLRLAIDRGNRSDVAVALKDGGLAYCEILALKQVNQSDNFWDAAKAREGSASQTSDTGDDNMSCTSSSSEMSPALLAETVADVMIKSGFNRKNYNKKRLSADFLKQVLCRLSPEKANELLSVLTSAEIKNLTPNYDVDTQLSETLTLPISDSVELNLCPDEIFITHLLHIYIFNSFTYKSRDIADALKILRSIVEKTIATGGADLPACQNLQRCSHETITRRLDESKEQLLELLVQAVTCLDNPNLKAMLELLKIDISQLPPFDKTSRTLKWQLSKTHSFYLFACILMQYFRPELHRTLTNYRYDINQAVYIPDDYLSTGGRQCYSLKVRKKFLRDASSTSLNELTPLGAACLYAPFEVIDELLENKDIMPNKACPNGLKPIHYACIASNSEAVTLLVRYGVKLTETCDLNGDTPLEYAILFKRDDLVKYICKMLPRDKLEKLAKQKKIVGEHAIVNAHIETLAPQIPSDKDEGKIQDEEVEVVPSNAASRDPLDRPTGLGSGL